MKFEYFVILIILKNVSCYNPKRHVTTSSSYLKQTKPKNAESVIPARYKVTSKTNYDPLIQDLSKDDFPEVEYPSSIVDSSKPFYVTSSPFPDDVKSTLKSLIIEENNKAKAINYSLGHNENLNGKSKEKMSTTQVGVNDVTVTKGNEIESIDKGAIETIHKESPILHLDTETVRPSTEYYNPGDEQFRNYSSIETTDSQEMSDVLGLINDMNTSMTNITNIESSEFTEDGNSTLYLFQSDVSEFPNEFTRANLLNMTSINNGSIIDFNEYSLPTEEDII